MNTIIEKIRAEVNRLKIEREGFRDAETESELSTFYNGQAMILDEFLSFLSDLEKECEKPINAWSNTPIKAKVKETGKYIMGFTDGKGHLHIPVDHNSFLQYNIDELEFDTLQEQPVSDDLEKECEEKPTLAEGLEEAADVWYEKCLFPKSTWWDEGEEIKLTDSKETFIAGAKWQREQIKRFVEENIGRVSILFADAVARDAIDHEFRKCDFKNGAEWVIGKVTIEEVTK